MNADRRESIMCLVKSVAVVLALGVFVFIVFRAGYTVGYKDGWCESLGGSYMAQMKCEVDQQIVKVGNE